MNRDRYSLVAILFHWTIAMMVIVNLVLGFWMGLLKGLAQFNLFQLHKSVGVTILLFSLARLAWRLVRPPPPASPALRPWERRAATAVHWAFYGVMIGMPLTGWLLVSTSPLHIPTLLYRLVPWPAFPGVHALPSDSVPIVNAASDRSHVVLAFGALGLLALHLGAVAKHQFWDGHRVLGRMWPFGNPVSRGL